MPQRRRVKYILVRWVAISCTLWLVTSGWSIVKIVAAEKRACVGSGNILDTRCSLLLEIASAALSVVAL